MPGPLQGTRVIEMAAIGPVPFCATVLADLGADVVRVDRATSIRPPPTVAPPDAPLGRGRRSIAVDCKHPDGADVVRRLARQADVLLEGFRPGVMERLGLGPDPLRAAHPGLVYGRMTGFGQSGPLADAPGHDMNYLAIAGVLGALGPPDGPPAPPLNLVGDYGGGLLLAVGVLAALQARAATNEGQVVDCAMVESAALMMTPNLSYMQSGSWNAPRGENVVDGGAPYYTSYATSDGHLVAFGAIEAQFYAAMLDGLGLTDERVEDQNDRTRWSTRRARIAAVVAGHPLDHWEAVFATREACFTPVLAPLDAPTHPHNVARGVFFELDGYQQAAPAPRFSRDAPTPPTPAPEPGADTLTVLHGMGFTAEEVTGLVGRGAVAHPDAANSEPR